MSPYGMHNSGGTALLAYQLRIVQKLIATRGMPEYSAGVSSGALIAACVGMGPAGVELLDKLIHDVDGAKWFQALSPGKSGLFSMKPLERQIRKHKVAETLVIPVFVGTVDLGTGKYMSVKLNDLDYDARVAALLASCTQPGIHEATQLFGRWMADGGLRNVIPQQPGGHDCDIVAICSSPVEEAYRFRQYEQHELNTAIEQMEAAFGILMGNVVLADIQELIRRVEVTRANLEVYAPKTWTRVGRPFDASRESMQMRVKAGAADAEQPPRLQRINVPR